MQRTLTAAAGTALVGMFLACGGAGQKAGSSSTAAVAPRESVTLAAGDLLVEWKANPVAAIDKYRGKQVWVTGKISGFSSDVKGDHFYLEAGQPKDTFDDVAVYYSEKTAGQVKGFPVGSWVVAGGVCGDESRFQPWMVLEDLRPADPAK